MSRDESLSEPAELDPQNRARYWAEGGVAFAADFFLGFIDDEVIDPTEKAKMSADAHRRAAERRQKIVSVRPKYVPGRTDQTLVEASKYPGAARSYERMVDEVVEGRGNKDAFANTLAVWTEKMGLQDRLFADEGRAHQEIADFLEAKVEAATQK